MHQLQEEVDALAEGITLPKKGDPPLEIKAYGKTLTVKRAKGSIDWVLTLGKRTRWGNKKEALSDSAYFKDSGALPPKSPGPF